MMITSTSNRRRKAGPPRDSMVGPARGFVLPVRMMAGIAVFLGLVVLVAGMSAGWIRVDSLSAWFSAAAGRFRAATDGSWWVAPLVVFFFMAVVEVVISLFMRLIPARKGHEWEMPDSELTAEELRERREFEAEMDARDVEEPRTFMLRRSTWFFVGMFALAAGGTLAIDLAASWHLEANRADPQIELTEIARGCPPLKDDVHALLRRGSTTADEVESMRVRARVISTHPVRGQECSA